jgi:hypothetical protein
VYQPHLGHFSSTPHHMQVPVRHTHDVHTTAGGPAATIAAKPVMLYVGVQVVHSWGRPTLQVYTPEHQRCLTRHTASYQKTRTKPCSPFKNVSAAKTRQVCFVCTMLHTLICWMIDVLNTAVRRTQNCGSNQATPKHRSTQKRTLLRTALLI